MAGNIQGLTVIINGDATPLTRAMREARAESATLRSHMTALTQLMKFDPSSLALITRQQQLMNAQLTQAAARMQMLKQAEREFYASVGPHSEAEIRQFQRLQREITEAELQMARLRQQAVQMGLGASASTLQWAGRLEKASTALSKVSTQALATSAVVGLLGAAAVKSAYDFEQSFAGVRKTIIATDEEYAKLARSTRDIALVKPIDVNDVNEIMMYAGQLGIANEYLTKFASTMADLDVATDMDLEEGSMQLARFTNIVGMSQGDVDRLGATIVDLGNNSATTESQIMLMSMRIAGAGANLGMTASDVLGLGATLSSLGIQAEMGGNAIATIMNRIDKDVALNNASLSTWAATAGMSAEEFKVAWTNDVTGTLLKVITGMGTFRDEGNNLNVLLKDMGISYMRQIDTMQRLSRAGELATQLIGRANTAWQNNTALVREATQRYDTAASKTQMMKNAINELGITIGNEILPAFKDVVLSVTGAIQTFAKMDDGTKSTIVNIMGLVTAGGLAIKGLELLTGAGAGLIRMLASAKTALGLMSAGQLTYTNMTIATTAALTGNTAALEANGLAKVQNMTFGKALAGGMQELALKCLMAAEAAGVETTALMGLNSVAIVGLTAGVAALVVGLTALAVAAINTANPVNQLTYAAKQQADAIKQHEAEYAELVRTEGEHSQAAIAAKTALDEEKEAFKSSNLTLGEFRDNMQGAYEDQLQLSQNLEDGMQSAKKSAGTMWNLADSIEELSKSALDDSDSMSKMQAQIDALNQLVPELGLYFDRNTGSLQSQAGAWRAVVDEAARTKVAEQAVSNYNNALAEQPQLISNLEAATKEYNNTARSWVELAEAGAIAWEDIPVAAQMAAQAYSFAKDALDENNAAVMKNLEILREHSDRQTALKYAMQDMATFTGDATAQQERANEVAEKYSEMLGVEIDGTDVLNAMLEKQAERAAESSQNVEELADELQELMVSNSAFSDTVIENGWSLSDLATKLDAAGISADDLAKAIEETADKVSNGFEKISDSSEVSLDEYIENLRYNIEATKNWGNNVESLYNMAGTSYERDFVQYVASLGPEYAAFVQELVNDSDGFHNAAAIWSESMQTGATATIQSTGITSDAFNTMRQKFGMTADQMRSTGNTLASNLIKAMTDMKNGTVSNANASASGVTAGMNNMSAGMRNNVPKIQSASNDSASAISSVNRHSGSMAAWGRSTLENFANGMRNRVGNVNSSAKAGADAAATIDRYSGKMWDWGYQSAMNYAKGILAAKKAAKSAASSVADGIKSVFGHSIAKEGPLHNKGKGEIGWGEETIENYIEGMERMRGPLGWSASSLAGQVSSAFGNQQADWEAATRTTAQQGADELEASESPYENVVTKWLDENLGPVIAAYTPVVSTRDFTRMVNEAVANA